MMNRVSMDCDPSISEWNQPGQPNGDSGGKVTLKARQIKSNVKAALVNEQTANDLMAKSKLS